MSSLLGRSSPLPCIRTLSVSFVRYDDMVGTRRIYRPRYVLLSCFQTMQGVPKREIRVTKFSEWCYLLLKGASRDSKSGDAEEDPRINIVSCRGTCGG